jgi:hypothetical protein
VVAFYRRATRREYNLSSYMITLRRAFVAASIVWAALLPVAPFAASQPAPAPIWYGLAFVVYGAGSFICHQMPARSFHSWSAQWPVCARCTGIYFGAAVVAVITMVRLPPSPLRGYGGPRKPDPTYDTGRARVLLAVAALPTAVTLISEWTTGVTPSNAIRALAGAPLGAAIAFIIVEALRDRGGSGFPPSPGFDEVSP